MSTTMNATAAATPAPDAASTKQANTLQASNIQRVQALVREFQNGNPAGYLAGVADDVKGSMLGGLIPGAENITNKAEFIAVFDKLADYMEVKKFEPTNWRAVNDDVLFSVEWEFVYKPTGVTHETTALVRKVVKDGMICEKYHMCDVEAITGKPTPHDTSSVTTVQALLAEFQAGRPEGYMAGVADDVKADMLGGLIPGAEAISNKEQFFGVMGQMDQYMQVQKFAPRDFRALPNGDMMFLVDWQFTWLATGKAVETTAVVRKVVKDGKICEKYHMCDVEAVLAPSTSPRDVIAAGEA